MGDVDHPHIQLAINARARAHTHTHTHTADRFAARDLTTCVANCNLQVLWAQQFFAAAGRALAVHLLLNRSAI